MLWFSIWLIIQSVLVNLILKNSIKSACLEIWKVWNCVFLAVSHNGLVSYHFNRALSPVKYNLALKIQHDQCDKSSNHHFFILLFNLALLIRKNLYSISILFLSQKLALVLIVKFLSQNVIFVLIGTFSSQNSVLVNYGPFDKEELILKIISSSFIIYLNV